MKEVRMFERKISGMPGTETSAGGYDGGMRIGVMDERQYLFKDISFVLQIALDTFGGMKFLGIETFFIDAVDTIDLDGTGFDLFAEGVYDLPVLVIEEAGRAGREKEDGFAGVTKYQQFHVPAQGGTGPPMIFSFHGF